MFVCAALLINVQAVEYIRGTFNEYSTPLFFSFQPSVIPTCLNRELLKLYVKVKVK
jgi:hypothetical protein